MKEKFNFLLIFSYASTFELGHYTRLEQLQKRLWYFSYLKYPVSSIYLYIANSIKSILSSEQPSLVYSNPCSGCLRCQPSLMDQYRLSQEKPKSTFFSRIYQSNRTNPKPVVPELTEPVENPNCGIEYCMNFDKEPLQLWAKLTNDDRSFEIDLSNKFERFNYDKVKYPKESFNVQHIRFYPNPNLISLHMLINHEKLDKKKENEETDLGEYRIELSEKTLKFIEISNDLLLAKKSTLKPIFNKLEEDGLEKKAIFLFNRRQQHN
ncbi:unnamed protein product [Rotaria magnacalcarata]|uniref:Uncharacterized protein n=1 Tax=Rotaria magnacalcarata TaxID=392030 RepID=A0A820DNH4_9BILA|nr:unnamed protein product [Rotaria magnacalcarata]CAF4085766.1 unnamed protein product [Rotaria magnacalcarata]CAF4102042.1 unnamed protein product [Rotaria magnacalcarata]CAF4228611.1 unnamed protein product [Rotaria magnacalcarata]CAF4234740.1 unnamed protein product [Rotaria magnacalcarata]